MALFFEGYPQNSLGLIAFWIPTNKKVGNKFSLLSIQLTKNGNNISSVPYSGRKAT